MDRHRPDVDVARRDNISCCCIEILLLLLLLPCVVQLLYSVIVAF